jgi:hypothetical protein
MSKGSRRFDDQGVTKKPRGRPRLEHNELGMDQFESLEWHGSRRAQAVLRDRPFTPEQGRRAVEIADRARITNARERLEKIQRGEKVYGLRIAFNSTCAWPPEPTITIFFPGLYVREDRATPVGGRHPKGIRNEPTLEEARRVAAHPESFLELVELTEEEMRRATITPITPIPRDGPAGVAADPLVAEILGRMLGNALDSNVRNLQHHKRRLTWFIDWQNRHGWPEP